MDYKFYELDCGVKAEVNMEENGCVVSRGLIDAGYSIAIKATHYPSFEETEAFIKKDLEKMGYDGVYGITSIPEEEVHLFFDDSNIDEWPVLGA